MIPDRIGKKEVGVPHRQPVRIHIDLFKGTLTCLV